MTPLIIACLVLGPFAVELLIVCFVQFMNLFLDFAGWRKKK